MPVVNIFSGSPEVQYDPTQHLANILNMGDAISSSVKALIEVARDNEAHSRRTNLQSELPNKPKTLLQVAQQQYKMRRQREAVFSGLDVFGEPAWDILLDLFITRQSSNRISVSSVCIASNVPPTTALRWIRELEILGLIVREGDQKDRRRTFILLSSKGEDLMEKYLSHYT